jgi:hypothetical protein
VSYDFPGTVGSGWFTSTGYLTNVAKLTVSIWFFTEITDGGGAGSRGGVLWSHGDIDSETAILGFMTGNKLSYKRNHTYGNNNRSTWETTLALTPIAGWKCIVLTHDASAVSTDPTIYVFQPGGSLVPYATVRTGTGISGYGIADSNYRVGNNSHASTAPFKGKISSSAVWNRILTLTEMNTIVRKGDRSVPSGTKLGWDMLAPATSPPNISDWTNNNMQGIPSGVTFSTDNPPKIPLPGPVMVV